MGRRHDPLGEASAATPPAGAAPTEIGALLGAVTRARGWTERLEGARIHAAWQRIAGREVARHVQPVRLHGGVLVLRADSSEWATQVQYLGAEIVARTREELTDVALHRVTVTVAGGRGGARR